MHITRFTSIRPGFLDAVLHYVGYYVNEWMKKKDSHRFCAGPGHLEEN